MAGSAAYRILELIGHGAAGDVHRALDDAGRVIALKLMNASEAARAGLLDRLAAEVALSRRLAHPGLVRLLDSGEIAGQPFVAMELIEGPTLKSEMARRRPPVARSLTIVAAAAGTLAMIHAAGAVHRDIKPGNIMLRGGTEPVLMDLGVAAFSDADRRSGGDLVGSPAYLAPEVIDDRPFDGKADVFALGVVLYMLVTGQRPFDGLVDQVMDRIRRDEPVPPSSLDPSLAPAIDTLVASAMAKNPSDRLSSRELAEAAAALAGSG